MEDVKPTSNYVGSYADYENSAIVVWERDAANPGVRTTKVYPKPFYFYVPDDEGEYTSIFGDKLKRLDFDCEDDMKIAIRMHPTRFESDIGPEAKILMTEYYDRPVPPVNYVFFDIENDYTQKIGYATMENPYAPINAVTVYQSWTNSFIAYIVPPKGMTLSDKFQDTVNRMWKYYKIQDAPNVVVCSTEEELLVALLNDIQSADIISGWNSAFFDLPYVVKRLLVIRPKLVNKLCFPGCKPPRESTVEKFGNPQLTYQLSGRTHLDFLDLFKKFTFTGRVSYALGAIGEEDLKVTKLEHDGSLEQLYKGTYRPDVTEMTLEEADALPDEIQRNNARREMMRRELVRRGVMKEDVNV